MAIPIETGGLHQFRVTPVTVDGILPAKLSYWTYASSTPGVFEAPTDVRITSMEGGAHGVRASIALRHQGLPSCNYTIDVIPNGSKSIARRIVRQARDVFQNQLEDLDFGQNYTISIRSTDLKGLIVGSTSYTRWFETPSCLNAWNHNFSVCGNCHTLLTSNPI